VSMTNNAGSALYVSLAGSLIVIAPISRRRFADIPALFFLVPLDPLSAGEISRITSPTMCLTRPWSSRPVHFFPRHFLDTYEGQPASDNSSGGQSWARNYALMTRECTPLP
jgi:hypothetical protein